MRLASQLSSQVASSTFARHGSPEQLNRQNLSVGKHSITDNPGAFRMVEAPQFGLPRWKIERIAPWLQQPMKLSTPWRTNDEKFIAKPDPPSLNSSLILLIFRRLVRLCLLTFSSILPKPF